MGEKREFSGPANFSMDRAAFNSALSTFVDASVEGQGWGAALSKVESALDIRAAIMQGLETFEGRTTTVVEGSASLPPETVALYANEFAEVDVRATCRDRFAIGQPVFDEGVDDDLARLDRTPIYAELYRPYDVGRFVGIRLIDSAANGRHNHIFFTLLRPNNASYDAELNEAAITLAHVVRGALRSNSAFAALRDDDAIHADALDAASFGVIVLGADQQILRMNTAARRAVDSRDALVSRNGKLWFNDQAAQATLERMCDARRPAAQGRVTFAAPRPAPARNYGIVLTPLRPHVSAWLAPRAVATAFIIDPDAKAASAEDLWRAVFQLTAAEAAVAKLLVSGCSESEIALMRGVARSTVHSQFKRIFEKLEVSSQAQAVSLLCRTAPIAG